MSRRSNKARSENGAGRKVTRPPNLTLDEVLERYNISTKKLEDVAKLTGQGLRITRRQLNDKGLKEGVHYPNKEGQRASHKLQQYKRVLASTDISSLSVIGLSKLLKTSETTCKRIVSSLDLLEGRDFAVRKACDLVISETELKLPSRELKAKYGLTAMQISRRRAKAGVKDYDATRTKNSGKSLEILSVIPLHGATGKEISDLLGKSHVMYDRLYTLIDKGKLYRIRDGIQWRYFVRRDA